MTPAERAAVHRMAGAFCRLSVAAQLVAQAKPGSARAALVDRMEEARRSAQRDFEAAQDSLKPPAESATELRDIYEQLANPPFEALGGINSVVRGDPAPPEMFSAEPSASPPPGTASTPLRAAQTPAPSTTKPVAPGAGSGRAVSARAGSIRGAALRLASIGGRFTRTALVEATKRSESVVSAALGKMVARGELEYTAPPGGRSAIARGVLGTYAVPGYDGAAPKLTPVPARVPVERRFMSAQLTRERRDQLAAAEAFLSRKEPLPAARPPVYAERGGRA